jgi:cell division protein FtsL
LPRTIEIDQSKKKKKKKEKAKKQKPKIQKNNRKGIDQPESIWSTMFAVVVICVAMIALVDSLKTCMNY